MSKIIVIGANHAGTAAINTILDNYEDDVVVFDGNSNISMWIFTNASNDSW